MQDPVKLVCEVLAATEASTPLIRGGVKLVFILV
jgi:hypothetical protein